MTSDSGADPASAPLSLPDLAYPIKVTGDLEELRYSLRSVHQHAAGLFRRVWVMTQDALPDWLTGVDVINAGAPGEHRAVDVRAKIAALVNHPDVAERVVILNDDHFLVDPITEWAAFHMGPTSVYVEHLRTLRGTSPSWMRTLTMTADWMRNQGHGDILVRQGHRPLLWDKARMAAALAAYPADRPLDTNGLYDIAGAAGEGTRATNAKITTECDFLAKLAARNHPWMSSNDRSFREGMIGGYIRGMFREPSPFEKAV